MFDNWKILNRKSSGNKQILLLYLSILSAGVLLICVDAKGYSYSSAAADDVNDATFVVNLPTKKPHVHKAAHLKSISATTARRTTYAHQPKLSPTEAAMLAKGEALRQCGRLDEAIQEYLDLIKLNPNLAAAHQRLGLAATANNNFWLAMNELQKAATLDDKDPDTYNDLGLIYLQLGDQQAARQTFWQAHILGPRHLNASINLAYLLSATGSISSALAIMRQAVVDHPNSATAHNNYAAILARTGNDLAAAKEFTRAVNLNGALVSAHYGLGLALFNLKLYPDAISEFQIAMKLNPGILDLQNKIDLANRCKLGTLASAQSIDY